MCVGRCTSTPVGRRDRDALGPQRDDLAALDVLHGAGLGEEGGYVGADELLALAAADDQRALLARGDQRLGLVEAHRDERVVTLHLGVRGAHGNSEVAGVVGGDQVRDDLGVGFGGKPAALRRETVLERHVVLDDPVDDDVDAIGAIVVGVRVLLADAAVGRPARVADAGRRGAREQRDRGALGLGGAVALPQLGLQRGEVPDGAHGFDAVLGDHGDPGAVIAAVLQALEAVQQQFARRALADVADDSTHSPEDTSGNGLPSMHWTPWPKGRPLVVSALGEPCRTPLIRHAAPDRTSRIFQP